MVRSSRTRQSRRCVKTSRLNKNRIYKINKNRKLIKRGGSSSELVTKSIERFEKAQKNGIKVGEIVNEAGKIYALDRDGSNYNTALEELFDEKKKQLRVYTFRIMPYNDALTFLFLCLQYV